MPLSAHKLAQVGLVVRDIEAARARWASLLGVEPPSLIETEPGDQVRQDYRGGPSQGRAKLCFFDLGGVQLELIEPIGEDTAWAEPLQSRGEGFHHLAFWTEEFDADEKTLAEHGVARAQRGDMGEGQYGYFDGQEQLGVFFELLQAKRPG